MDNIRMDLQEVRYGYMDWIGLAQDRDRWRTLLSAVMNLGVPRNAGNFLTSCKPVSCSRRTVHRGVSIIKLFCRAILRKYCVVAVYGICNRCELCLSVLLLCRPGAYRADTTTKMHVTNVKITQLSNLHLKLRNVLTSLKLQKFFF